MAFNEQFKKKKKKTGLHLFCFFFFLTDPLFEISSTNVDTNPFKQNGISNFLLLFYINSVSLDHKKVSSSSQSFLIFFCKFLIKFLFHETLIKFCSIFYLFCFFFINHFVACIFVKKKKNFSMRFLKFKKFFKFYKYLYNAFSNEGGNKWYLCWFLL